MLECRVSTKELEMALKKLEAIKNTTGIPMLDNIKLEISNGELKLSRTDLENHIITTIDADTNGIGSVLLTNAKETVKSFKFMNEWETVIDVIDNEVVISNGNRKLKLRAEVDENDIKEFEVKDIDNSYIYNTKLLHERMKKIDFARSKDTVRPSLCGIHFDRANIVALDGFRMSVNTDDRLTVNKPFTIAPGTVDLILKTINGKKEDKIVIETDDEYIIIKYENVVTTSKLIKQDFYNYKDILPKDYQSIKLNTKNMKDDITFLSNYSKAIKQQITKMNITNTNLEIEVNNETGIFNTDRAVDSDIDLTIAFNNKYMLDALKVISTDEVELCVTSSLNPITLRDNDNSIHLILPIRLAS